jgi:tetratricopeptide (TPR) repeat protein
MKPKLSADRKKSGDVWARMGRAYDRLVYWLYERQDASRARPLADRLEQLLAGLGPDAESSIFAEECRSLVHEARGNLVKAIKHREGEVRLIRRLHRQAKGTAGADFVFRQYSHADLSDRLDLLAMLYHDGGDLEKAIKTLKEAKKLCEARGMEFGGEDALREYREEASKRATKNAGTQKKGRLPLHE